MNRHVLSIVAAVLVTAGCGVPASGHLDIIDPAHVPFRLLSGAPPGSPVPQARGPAAAVYFVRSGRLVAESRRVVGDNVPEAALRLLLAGPSSTEVAAGVSSDVPTPTRLISLDLAGPVATVDLSSDFGTVGGSEQVLAVAQIVYTLTASHSIRSVRFALKGKPTEVPDGSGSLAGTPRTRQDYHTLAPPR